LHVLLLNQTFHPDVASTAQHLKDLASALAERGHRVTIMTSRRAYDNPAVIYPARERWRAIDIIRIRGSGFGKAAKWRRALDFATFLCFCALRALFLPRPDVIVALTSPPLISFIGACIARLRGARFVYWVMDLNPDEAIAAGWLKATSPLARLLDRISRFSLRHADRVIVLDRFMRDRILAKGIAPDRIAIIAPWSHDDAVHFDAAGRERFRKAHGLDGKFAVMYSGNHSPCHPLTTLLDAARQLASDSDVIFCFVGGGSEFPKVKRFAEEHRLRNILCLPYQPLDRLAASLSAADIHVVVMGEPFVGTIHPCKIYNILQVGAPFLCIGPEHSHLGDLMQELPLNGVCVRVSHGESDGIRQHIQTLLSSRPRLTSNVVDAANLRFSRAVLVPRQIALIESVVRSR
jgi:glycosyltransferase involved in cell wall biosynthesis